MGSGSPLERIADAAVGVLAYVTADGTPHAVPVTPFVVMGRIVVA
jgi:nitroimidazol reductase NimA-like FMN-containing flavoprotein (pyridoxamine 5'-phosphate oxidase superfamily)